MKTINDYAELVKEKHALNKTIAPVETNETDASRAYAVGEQLIFNGTLYDVIAPISQHDVITTTGSGANIAPAGSISAKIQTLTNNVGVLIDNGAVNKLPNNATTQTITGIQITVNADKSMTIGGSGNSATVDIFNDANNPIVLEEDCVFSCGATFTSSTCEIVATATDNTTYSLKLSTGNSILIPAGKNIKKVTWYNNASYDETLTIYPMIADADYSGGYVPYAMTNRELTEKSIIKDVSGYSWDSAIDGTKDIVVKRYGAIVSVYGYFRTTNALAQYANVLSGLPHCASGASLSSDIVHNMGMTLQNVDSATSKFVVNAATTANLQYAFNFVYLTDN